MRHAMPLPAFLIERHREQQARRTPEDSARLASLANFGQNPSSMIIACCDSRVMVSDLFGAEAGEFFVHRNIANLVPPCTPDSRQHGTSATIEFAVDTLKIGHLIVMAHSHCGGVAGCHAMLTDDEANAPDPSSFVGTWLEILKPDAAPIIARCENRSATLRALEQQTVLTSLNNLMSFSFVSKAVAAGNLQLHGLWTEIGNGKLEIYDPEANAFIVL